MRLSHCLVSLPLALSVAFSQADVLVEHYEFTAVGDKFTAVGDSRASIPAFNPALGTLTEVAVDLQAF